MTRRRYMVFSAVVILLLGIGVLFSGRAEGSSPIEAWIGHELEVIANHYLNPELHFRKLTYVYPKTVVVEDLTLESPDPEEGGGKVAIFEAAKVRLVLAQVPHLGEPLKIQELSLESPKLRLISLKSAAAREEAAAGAGKRQVKTQFVGFSHFLAKHRKPGQKKQPPSDFFQITKVEIENGSVEYDPRISGTKPFLLDGFNSVLHVNPNPPMGGAAGAGTRPARDESGVQQSMNGWYVLDLAARREPIFQLNMEGRINVDTMALEMTPLTAMLNLNEGTINRLPPQVQKGLAKYEARGKLDVIVTGTLAMKEMEKTFLMTHVGLTGGHFRIGKYEVPVRQMTADLITAHGNTQMKGLSAEVLGGKLTARGTVPLSRTGMIAVYVHAEHIGLARTVRVVRSDAQTEGTRQEGTEGPVQVAGLLSGDVTYLAPVNGWNREASGEGDVKLMHGRLPELPLLGDIVKGIASLGKVVGLDNGKPNDQAEMKFDFAGNKVAVKDLTAHSGSWALRGSGDIYFDGEVDLRVNAGPLERAEIIFGPIGRAVGSLTDSIAGYRVTGRIGKPEVSVEVGPSR